MDDALTVGLFFESWELFREAVLSGVIAGAVLGFLGVWIVIRRMIFLSAALSQVAGLGVALAFWAKVALGLSGWFVSPGLGALTASCAAIALVVSRRGDAERRDGLLGAIFLLGSAGTVLVGTRIVEEIQDIETLIFGTAVAVLPEDFHLLAGVGLALGVLHLWWWRGFLAVSLDREDAIIRKMPVWLLEVLLLGSIALAISLVTRVLGALPAFAFSVLPAMAAIRIAPNVQSAMWLAAILGGIAGFVGYLVAFLYELPVGASQAGAALVVLFLSSTISAALRPLAKKS